MGRLALSVGKALLVLALAGNFAIAEASPAWLLQQAANSPAATGVRTLGTIKSLRADAIVVSADSGAEVTAHLSPETRIMRVAPGQKDLTGATPVRVEDLQVGDRVLVRGVPGADAKDVKAASIIVMKQSEVAAKRDKEREDWQKRGVGGLVTAVDLASGTITISAAGLGAPAKKLAIHTAKDTVLRRYAPNSVKFDDARIAPLDQVKVGDQLRARGDRSADGAELSAQEVVSGSFRNIAGTVAGIDAGSGTLTVQDAISKKPVTVKIASDSTVKKLPPEMAQRIAMRLKGGNGGPGAGGAGAQGAARPPGGGGWQGPGGGPGGERSGGPPDLQRFISRLPDSTLGDLQKGDAVMVVSTEGADSGAVTAITLLAGVEPILTAAPNGAASAILSPWTLGSSSAEAAAP